MKSRPHRTIQDFYESFTANRGMDISVILPQGIQESIGHFNVFDLGDTIKQVREQKTMPYDRRKYYKISLIRGKNKAEYANKIIQIEKNALLFATPKVPYLWVPQDEKQGGAFCVFTENFILNSKSPFVIDELPLFQPGSYPLFELSDEMAEEIMLIFNKMKKEITTDYEFKYDLLRNYVMELIHHGQKLRPASLLSPTHNASERITSLFIELLERQFPIESGTQTLYLRTAKDYADRLAVHVNHLNKVLKETTGYSTTQIIMSRIAQEAKILLKQTDWPISDIAYALGFKEIAHFSNFFKKQTTIPPLAFRA